MNTNAPANSEKSAVQVRGRVDAQLATQIVQLKFSDLIERSNSDKAPGSEQKSRSMEKGRISFYAHGESKT